MQKIEKSVAKISQSIRNQEFICLYRLHDNAFTRQRKLTFGTVVATLIHLSKKSLQIVCNLLGNTMHFEIPPSKQAFSQARQKISYKGFQALHEEGLKPFYENDNIGLWRNYRVFGVDGSLCRLPDSEDAEAYFERWDRGGGERPGKQPIMGRISEVVELSSRIIVSGRLMPWRKSEQTLAHEQLNEVASRMFDFGQTKQLFVYDRGYPSKELIREHLRLGVDCLMRLPRKFNKLIDAAVKEGKNDCLLHPWPDLPEMRILVYKLPSGEKEVLLTTITRAELYPYTSFYEVYHARWGGLEETYKLQKISMELENFAGQSMQAILQEYWANLIAVNLLMMFEVERDGHLDLETPPKDRMNKAVVFGSLRDDIFNLIMAEISIEEFKNKFNKLAGRHRIKIKLGRSYSRVGVNKPKRYHVPRRVC